LEVIMGQEVPVKRTVVSMRDYANAALYAWGELFPFLPQKESLAILWAQYIIETGGKECWNWNIGNEKHVQGDPFDFQYLVGTWECVDYQTAYSLIAQGLAKADTNPDHIAACPLNKKPVIFVPPHPATCFRAFSSLQEAMLSHMRLLVQRFGAAWDKVVLGDPDAFAHALKAGRDGKEGTADDYFTASSEAYAKGMKPSFAAFMQSNVFDVELEALEEPVNEVSGGVVHPPIEITNEES
jgi:hypothetical protein